MLIATVDVVSLGMFFLWFLVCLYFSTLLLNIKPLDEKNRAPTWELGLSTSTNLLKYGILTFVRRRIQWVGMARIQWVA